jgi:hypothetical protein
MLAVAATLGFAPPSDIMAIPANESGRHVAMTPQWHVSDARHKYLRRIGIHIPTLVADCGDRRPRNDYSTTFRQVRILQHDFISHFKGRVRLVRPPVDGATVIPRDVIRGRISVFIFHNGDCRYMPEMT